jgi:UDP-glucose:(glucosyl)LPS alpha-1,3-glucosyltransferase
MTTSFSPNPMRDTAIRPIAALESPAFHIAFCVDNNYFRCMGALIASIVSHNPAIHFVFHVFAFSIADDQHRRIRELERRFQVTVETHLLDEQHFAQFKDLLTFSYYSLAIYSRFIIPQTLRGITDKVLYLDADMLCVGSLDELVQMDISNDIAAVAPDVQETTDRRCTSLNLLSGKYFNSGMLYMNVEKWLEHEITEQAMAALANHGKKLRFSDQDALNIVLDGRARYIGKKWNYIYDMVYDMDRNLTRMRPVEDAALVHFAGAVKPWADWSGHDARDMYMQYHAQSPWSDIPLDPQPMNTREMRLLSRFLCKRGQLLQGAIWYARYLAARKKKR